MTLPALVLAAAVTDLGCIEVVGERLDDENETSHPPPAVVRTVDEQEIASSGSADLGELLEHSANVQVRSTGPMQEQLSMRGFGENSFGRVKVLSDGVELNGVDMEVPNLAAVNLDAAGRVQVMPGPSPVLYGDGAVAGVVRVDSDSGDDRTRIAAKGGSCGMADLSLASRGEVPEAEGVRYFADYGYRRSDGYRDRSGYDLHAFGGGIRRDFADGGGWNIKANFADGIYEMPGALSYASWKSRRRDSVYRDDWCRLWNYGLTPTAKIALGDDRYLELIGAFSVRHRHSNWGDYHYANDYDTYGYRFSPRYLDESSLFGHDNRLTAGYEFGYDRHETRDRSGYSSPYTVFGRDRHALFVMEEFSLVDELSLVAGVRAERIGNRWQHRTGAGEDNADDILGDFELGLVYRPVDELKTYLKATRFHRSAFCDELGYTKDGAMLDPERGFSLDLGADYTPVRELHLSLAGFWMLIDDEIFYDPHAKDYGAGYWGGYNCNSPSRTERLGLESSVSYRREGVVEASLSHALTETRFRGGEYDDCDIPLVPECRTRAEVGVWVLKDLELKGGCRHVSSQAMSADFANDHARLPGYVTFDLGVHYSPRWAENWRLRFTVDNLLDRRYCDYAGWSDYTGAYCYPADGRTFALAVSYEF